MFVLQWLMLLAKSGREIKMCVLRKTIFKITSDVLKMYVAYSTNCGNLFIQHGLLKE